MSGHVKKINTLLKGLCKVNKLKKVRGNYGIGGSRSHSKKIGKSSKNSPILLLVLIFWGSYKVYQVYFVCI